MTDKPITLQPLPVDLLLATEDIPHPKMVREEIEAYARAAVMADRALNATAQGMWQPIETAPKNPIKRVLLRWVSGQSEWICIGAWASAEDSPRLKIAGCPREGWMPDAGTCIPRNQKDCVGWMRLPSAAPIQAVDAVAGEPVAWKSELKRAISEYADALEDERYAHASDVHSNICRLIDTYEQPPRAGSTALASGELLEALTELRDIVQGLLDDRLVPAGRIDSFTLQPVNAAIARAASASVQGVMGAQVDMTDSELTALLLKVYPHVATPHLKMARAAIAADRTRRLVLAEPWLKAGEVSERMEGSA
jgi:hypothetical protein